MGLSSATRMRRWSESASSFGVDGLRTFSGSETVLHGSEDDAAGAAGAAGSTVPPAAGSGGFASGAACSGGCGAFAASLGARSGTARFSFGVGPFALAFRRLPQRANTPANTAMPSISSAEVNGPILRKSDCLLYHRRWSGEIKRIRIDFGRPSGQPEPTSI